MKQRMFGRVGWSVGEVGYGLWGMAAWSGSDDAESLHSLSLAVQGGCNFFDTALAYAEGRNERLMGQLLQAHPTFQLYTATKVPPLNRIWPAAPGSTLDETFPPDYVRETVGRSLANLGVRRLDLMQFHVWNDEWAGDRRWQVCVQDLKRDGLVEAVGLSVNRWEPENCLDTLRTGLIDAVQVVYNIFDQSPEDSLFPLCRQQSIAVIARVPFDEGSLTGSLGPDSRWPEGDWRNTYFHPGNLQPTLDRVRRLEGVIPPAMPLSEVALRFILCNPDVSTVIPGMRKAAHVEANLGVSDKGPLESALLQRLKEHRWDRRPPHLR